MIAFLIALMWFWGSLIGYAIYERSFRDYVGCETSAGVKIIHAVFAGLLGPFSPYAAGLTMLSCPPDRE